MKLSSFSVNNYRSITKAHKIQTDSMTVLVGKNNEGKSNILRALNVAMNLMKLYAENPRALSSYRRYYNYKKLYNWEYDYPVSLQEKNANGNSSIDLVFELSESEIADIRSITGIRLTSGIPVRVYINATNARIDIPKGGTHAFSDPENKQKIIEYVCKKIDFIFIPAVRTERDSLQVIRELIENELAALENDPEYLSAMETVNKLQESVLNRIACEIVTPLQEYLPSVRDVRISVQKEQRRVALRKDIEVTIDDGTPTPIEFKGDGIKSLTALAMLNNSSQSDKVSVIAIEEPESHLHPESARQLHETIIALSQNHQVVLTTHSPLFVNRVDLKSNIIVNSGKATAVKKIKEIRDVLGTRVSDNLINAEFALVVEGETDKITLSKILPQMSEKIKRALQNGVLVIDYLAGSGNPSYILSHYTSIQCRYHVLLDNDDAGRSCGEAAQRQGLLDTRSTTYTICSRSRNSELEDCIDPRAYARCIMEKYGVDIEDRSFRGNKKWSERMEKCFQSQGKQWNSAIEKEVKIDVANSLPSDPSVVLNEHKRSAIDALVNALEQLLP